MNHFIMEECKEKDLGQLLILMKAYREFYQVDTIEDQKIVSFLQDIMHGESSGTFLVCKTEDKIVGFATLYFTFSSLKLSKALILNDFFTDSSYRNQGVGQILFDGCRDYARLNGFSHIEWVTDEKNETAQRFYEKNGSQRSNWLSYSIS